MGSHHCAAVPTTALVQQAVIVSLVLGLGPVMVRVALFPEMEAEKRSGTPEARVFVL